MFIKTNTTKISKIIKAEEIDSIETRVKVGEKKTSKLSLLEEIVEQTLKDKKDK